MDHLRFADKSDAEQQVAIVNIVRGQPVLMQVLETLRDLDMPDWWVVSGAIYNVAWNVLTGRAPLTGLKDIDVIYFDSSDLSYEAEDREIRRLDAALPNMMVPVELRNQARVHLWFPDRFNLPFEPLNCATDSLLRYASKTHAVAVRLEADETIRVHAPFGLNDLFSFRIVPNPALDNRHAHEEKGARAKSVWPEVQVESW